MSPEAQRIAIAEACQWKRHILPSHDAEGVYGNENNKFVMIRWTAPNEQRKDSPFWWKADCPDYLNDLNAMHEAEKVLDSATQWNGEEHHANAEEAYLGWLSTVCKGNDRFCDDWRLICATAAQRAEAFLKTLDLWTD